MRIKDADALIQSNIVNLLAIYTFPVYCTTNVDNFEYHFIGSGFFVKWDDKCVFVMTKHQYDKALDGNIFVLSGDEEKGINVRSDQGIIYPHSDLVIFEVPDPSDLITSEKLKIMPIMMLLPPKSYDDYQVLCMGYPTKLSAVDYASKIISPKMFGFVSNKFSINPGRDPMQVSLSDVELTTESRDITDLNEATQGLSGSPVMGFKIAEDGKNGEMALLGVATHITTNPKVLYATRTLELIDCFQHGFGFFDKQKAEDTEQI